MANKQTVFVYVSSSHKKACPICGEWLDGERFENACNHLLTHSLKCLHVGQETSHDNDGKPWHSTVAVFSD